MQRGIQLLRKENEKSRDWGTVEKGLKKIRTNNEKQIQNASKTT